MAAQATEVQVIACLPKEPLRKTPLNNLRPMGPVVKMEAAREEAESGVSISCRSTALCKHSIFDPNTDSNKYDASPGNIE